MINELHSWNNLDESREDTKNSLSIFIRQIFQCVYQCNTSYSNIDSCLVGKLKIVAAVATTAAMATIDVAGRRCRRLWWMHWKAMENAVANNNNWDRLSVGV